MAAQCEGFYPNLCPSIRVRYTENRESKHVLGGQGDWIIECVRWRVVFAVVPEENSFGTVENQAYDSNLLSRHWGDEKRHIGEKHGNLHTALSLD